jgi:glutathione S-transferase
MTGLPVLWSFRRCPFAMRARMALSMSGQRVELREIILRDKPAEMLAASPKGTVPVLVDGETVVDESRAVMDWALARNDPENWLARRDPALIDACDGDFKHHLDRYKYASRYEGADAGHHRGEAMGFIETLEARLTRADFLHGAARGYTDIAIFPFIRQFRIADPDWLDTAPVPHARRWLKALMETDLFTSVMRKYPLWNDTGEAFVFPQPS